MDLIDKMVMENSLSPESILSKVDELTIYCHYIEEIVEIGSAIESPLRKDDIPSFSLFKSREGKILWKDHGTGESGDVFKFVGLLFNLNFYNTLKKIDQDFFLGFSTTPVHATKIKRVVPKIKEKVNIQITSRKFTTQELLFWKKFGVSEKTLKFYNVKPVSVIHYISNSRHDVSIPYEMCFAYRVVNDYKLYFPFAKTRRFLCTYPSHYIEGFNQMVDLLKQESGVTSLTPAVQGNDTSRDSSSSRKRGPKRQGLLIITKSLKDVMVLHELGFYSVSPRSENTVMKNEYFDYFNQFFEKVLVLFDNDMKHKGDEYPYSKIHLPLKVGKDISDVVKAIGKRKAKKLLKEMINEAS